MHFEPLDHFVFHLWPPFGNLDFPERHGHVGSRLALNLASFGGFGRQEHLSIQTKNQWLRECN